MLILRTAMVAAMLFGSIAAVLQQSPAPAANGPSLVDTMHFIEDKLKNNGDTSYTVPWGDGSSSVPSETWLSVVADPATCTLTLKSHHVLQDGSLEDYSETAPLLVATKIVVGTMRSLWVSGTDKYPGSPDHPDLRIFFSSATATTHLFTTRPDTSHKADKKHPAGTVTASSDRTVSKLDFLFEDPDNADRTAKAFVHAIELCGGGKRELF